MKMLRVLHWAAFVGSVVFFIYLLLMDFRLLPIRGTEFSRAVGHVTAMLVMIPSGYRLKSDSKQGE